MDALSDILSHSIPTIIGSLITYFVTRRKTMAEVRKMDATTDKTMAETAKSVSEAAINLYEKLARRLQALEECKQMQEAIYKKEIQRLGEEIRLIKKRYELVVVELETARTRLEDALKLATYNEVLARSFYDQLEENGITPTLFGLKPQDLFPDEDSDGVTK